jgi:hypothetical protein
VEVIEPPRVEHRPGLVYAGIRVITAFRGMLKVRDALLQELRAWLEESGTEPGRARVPATARDRHGRPDGDRGRLLADPRAEPRKTKWDVELAFRVVDD